MSSAIEGTPSGQNRHKRTTPIALNSIVTTRSQKAGELGPPSPTKATSPTKNLVEPSLIRPQEPLGEISHNRERGQSKQQVSRGMDTSGLRDKRTKSVISLKAITGRDKGKQSDDNTKNLEKGNRFKKSKSSTNLSTFLSKSKSTKDIVGQGDRQVRNKENQPPIQTIREETPPIWAEFAQRQGAREGHSTKVPLNDTRKATEQAALYTPREYSPSKGRIFPEQPSLKKPDQQRPSSKHGYFDGARSNTQFTGAFSRLRKASSSSLKKEKNKEAVHEAEVKKSSSRPTTADGDALLQREPSKLALGTAKGGSRVKAAVAALSGKVVKDEPPPSTPKEQKASAQEIESAFEQMLVRALV